MPTPLPPLRRALASASTLALLTLLSACGGPGAVEASTLEEKVREAVSPAEGSEVEIDCPDDLAAEVDATATCVLEDGEGRTGVRFTTTEVDGDEVSYETTLFLEEETLESTLMAQLADQGIEADRVECPDDLDGVEDETTECTASAGGEEGSIELRVTGVDGFKIGFSWKVV